MPNRALSERARRIELDDGVCSVREADRDCLFEGAEFLERAE
jgi:hypothetical protein